MKRAAHLGSFLALLADTFAEERHRVLPGYIAKEHVWSKH